MDSTQTTSSEQNQLLKINDQVAKVDTMFNRSIGSMPYIFTETYGEDGPNILKFCLYLTHNLDRDRDIFGCIKVDLNKFAAFIGKSKSHFQEKVDLPLQFENRSKSEIEALKKSGLPLYDNRFGNMLYKMSKINIDLDRKPDSKNKLHLGGNSFFQIIKQIDIFRDDTKNGKLYYVLLPSDEFLRNLSKEYMLISPHTFNLLDKGQRKKLDHLYLHVAAWKNYARSQNLSSVTLNFDRVCRICDLMSNDEPSHRKEKMILYFKDLKAKATDLDFDFDFIRGTNQRWKYTPLLTFHNNHQEPKQLTNQRRQDFFDSLLVYYWKEAFVTTGQVDYFSDLQYQFNTWINNKELDTQIKRDAYCTAHKIAWGKEVEPMDDKVTFFLQNLKHKYADANVI